MVLKTDDQLIKILQLLKFFLYSYCISDTLLNDVNCGSEFSALPPLNRRLGWMTSWDRFQSGLFLDFIFILGYWLWSLVAFPVLLSSFFCLCSSCPVQGLFKLISMMFTLHSQSSMF